VVAAADVATAVAASGAVAKARTRTIFEKRLGKLRRFFCLSESELNSRLERIWAKFGPVHWHPKKTFKFNVKKSCYLLRRLTFSALIVEKIREKSG